MLVYTRMHNANHSPLAAAWELPAGFTVQATKKNNARTGPCPGWLGRDPCQAGRARGSALSAAPGRLLLLD